MIFTSQVWNMAFSFHGSLRALPESYKELGNLAGLNWFGKLIRIELPFSAIGLAWNSLMSMAGGWFFLVVCESFTLGEQNFRLPGIGSYMAVAIEQNNRPAMLYGCGAMFLLIIFVDFFVWRPVLAWTSKFKSDDFSTEAEPIPFMTLLLKDSWLVSVLQNINDTIGPGKWIELLSKDSYPTLTDSKPNTRKSLEWRRLRVFRKKRLKLTLRNKALLRTILSRGSIIITIIVLLWGFTRLWELIRLLNFKDWQNIFAQAGFSMVRVFLAVAISTIWTVPFGIWVGLSPRLTRFFQPLVQIAASFPAPMIFPLVMLVMDRAGIAFGIWPIILIVLGVQWYILFNVLAGATNMPRELKDCVDMMGIKGFRKWFRFYIPSIFPHLVTGWMTAAGGAWNATIVTEIVQYQGKTLVAQGLGSLIAQATAKADFPLLSGALIVMVAAVISINRLVWLKLINIAESKFER
jgi:NitT/TauT family transport system permease protein